MLGVTFEITVHACDGYTASEEGILCLTHRRRSYGKNIDTSFTQGRALKYQSVLVYKFVSIPIDQDFEWRQICDPVNFVTSERYT